MAPSCFVLDPMDCIYERSSASHSLQKRAPPSGGEGTVPPADSDSPGKVIVLIAAIVGSLLLIFSLGLFYCCMRRRRANRRIGQLQHFLPTFMDKEKTEKYFQNQNSSSTLVSPKDPSQPANAHHRTRSVPVAFAKGVKDHRNRQLERDGSLGQFQQISLGSDDNVNEKEELTPRRSFSGARTRARATTVSAPAPVVSSLHRSVSLNKHSTSNSMNNRTGTVEEEEPETPSKFADGESLVAPNRFSALLDFSQDNNTINRFSAMSISGMDPNFDPTRFSTTSVMFDAKRISTLSTATSDDTISISSSDDFNNSLPPHQKHHSFHSHHNSPTLRSREVSTDVPVTVVPNHPSYYGEKQELEDDDEVVSQHVSGPYMDGGYAAPMGSQGYQNEFYPPLQQNSLMSTPMPMPMEMPIPTHMAVAAAPAPAALPRIMLSRPHGGQEMSLATGDREMEDEHSS
ncbi:hypothetical protein BGZ51_009835 [Haplosporangium sp. Z 767]|nr:hypothetical protein BGZ50_006140 [Haplosporangium sp. Z 11]KAF9189169.1 hypothetical protein BGZ51_009835 [Haplosporangium sp. Z 767]